MLRKYLKISALLLTLAALTLVLCLAVSAESDGWHNDGGKWCLVKNGTTVKNAFVKDSKGTCYAGADGYIVYNKWIWGPDGWYHLNENGYLDKNMLIADTKGLCLVDSAGRWVTATGWHTLSGKWLYVDKNQRLAVNKWVADSKGWCHLNSQGFLDCDTVVADSVGACLIDKEGRYVSTVGWQTYKGKWAYIGENGRLVKSGWVYDGKGWCHIGEDYFLETDTILTDTVGACLVDKNGYWAQSKGWLSYGGKWYYNGDNSHLVINGWITYKGGSYHLGYDGTLDTDTIVMDAIGFCLVDKNGLLVKSEGWHTLGDSSKVYMGKNGHLTVGSWVQYDGGWYHLNLVGILDTSTLVADGSGYCYVDSEGRWDKTVGWKKLGDGQWTYVDNNHRAICDSWINDGKGWCHMNAYGCLETDTLVQDSDGYCLVSAEGYWITAEGWYTVQGTRKVLVGTNKRAVCDAWRYDNNGWYHLNSGGWLDTSTVVRDTKGFCYVNEKGYWITAEGFVTVSLWDTATSSVRDFGVYIEKSGYLKKSGNDFYRQ